MAHVSKNRLHQKIQKDISDQLNQYLFSKTGSKSRNQISREILTETEKIMLAKRLAIVVMLIEERSYYQISILLKVSTSTIKRLHSQLLHDGFPTIEKILADKKERELFWKDLNALLRAGMPPIAGRGRWKWLFDNKFDNK